MTDNGRRTLYGVYGAGGCGRGVLPVAEQMLSMQSETGPYELVFVDDEPREGLVNGRRVLSFDEFCEEVATERCVSLAVADVYARKELASRCEARGIDIYSVVSPNSLQMDAVEIGPGAVISPFVTFTSNIRFGRFFHANLYAYVEHDCVVGDFVTFAPGARCNGNVLIEDFAYLGAGCVIKQGTRETPLVIGAGATIGMGAVVTRSVPAGATVVGNPARLMERASA